MWWKRQLLRHFGEMWEKDHYGSPGTALFLLCLALHQESQQPLSGNKGTPGGRDNKKNRTRYVLWKSLCTPRCYCDLLKSSGTDRVPRLGRYELADEAVLLAEPLVFVSLHCPHVLQVDCGPNTAWRHVRKRTKDRFMRWLHSTRAGLTVTYLNINRKDNCLHLG